MPRIPSLRLALLALLVLFAGVVAGCGAAPADLAIVHATVFDSQTARALPDRTVLVARGRIVAVLASSAQAPRARKVLEARGRLLTPGLVDAHGHSWYVLGDSMTAGGGFVTHLVPRADSIAEYRRRYAAAYLPFGITAVRDVGSAEADLPILLDWQRRPSSDLPDLLVSGGALVSEEPGWIPFPGHAVVADSADAVRRVDRYHDLGIRNLKLYWRLREPEMRAAFAEARRWDMVVTAHVDFGVVPFEHVLDLGVTHFEHAYTLGVGVLRPAERDSIWSVEVPSVYADRAGARFYLGVLEIFHHLGPDDPRMLALIARLAKMHATVDPTLHIFAQRIGLTRFRTPVHAAFDDDTGLTSAPLERAREGYRNLAGYVRRLHAAGVGLAVGSDWLAPGQVCLSEIELLHAAGIPMNEVLSIATLGSARAIGAASVAGSIEPGRRANLVLWERSPLEDPANVTSAKTVIQNGEIAVAPYAAWR